MRFATCKMAESRCMYNNENNYCFDRQAEYATRPLYTLKTGLPQNPDSGM